MVPSSGADFGWLLDLDRDLEPLLEGGVRLLDLDLDLDFDLVLDLDLDRDRDGDFDLVLLLRGVRDLEWERDLE